MYVKLQLEPNSKDSDTYHCSHCEITKTPPDSPAATSDPPMRLPGITVDCCGCVVVTRERQQEDGSVRIEEESLSGETRILSLPADGAAIYVMNNKRATTHILRWDYPEPTPAEEPEKGSQTE